MPKRDIPVPSRNPKQSFEKLLRDVSLTKNCRFHASRRTRSISDSYLYAVTFLSFLNMMISLISIVFGSLLKDHQVRIIGVLVVLISVYLIVLDLIAARKSYDTRSLMFEKGGNALLDLRNEMRLKGPSRDGNTHFFRRYEQIRDEFGENHSDLDFRLSQAISAEKQSWLHWWSSFSHASTGFKTFAVIMVPVVILLAIAYLGFGALPEAKAP
jgi:hypothetical protein